jgi:glycerol-3-phosphate dehydrogenase (NAD(P)+)
VDSFLLVLQIDLVFIVVPSDAARGVFQKIAVSKIKKNCGFVICSKGIDQTSLSLLSDAFEKITGIKNYAALSGPNFAIEVAQQIPTVTTIASKDKILAKKVAAVLDNENFKTHYFSDPRTAEICGVVKNILAIGCGIIDGLELGINAKAALIMKGISEIRLLCKKLKASDDLINPAGFGDIFLTCSSTKSRNNSLGVLLGKGQSFAEISKKNATTYEGVASAKAVAAIAKKLKLRLDLCEEINEILTKKIPQKEIKIKISKAILN